MDKKFAKYMNWGKKVESAYTGEQYKLVDDMDPDTGEVLAVRLDHYRRWELLSAWLENGVAEKAGKTEEYQTEQESLVTTLRCENIVPIDRIKFITPGYEPLFEVQNLGKVKFNGNVKRVIYLDDYHFTFEDGAGLFGCFHICQFAELAQQLGWEITQIEH